MKNKDLLLIGLIGAGAYLLWRSGALKGLLAGGSGGGGIPFFPPVQQEGDTQQETMGATPEPLIRYDYSTAETITPTQIQQIGSKRIPLLQNIASKSNIPQLREVARRSIPIERKKQTIGVIQNIRDKTIIPQLKNVTERILMQMP